ncbi:MAG: hypothetical protein WCC48_03600 [Anaeromyxobacteraceae bacterium]
MTDLPTPRGLLDRLKSILPGSGDGVAATHPRWPHRTQRWLDPNVPIHGWRNRVEVADAPDVLRVIAEHSDGRIDDAGVAEVLDAIASDTGPASFRFGASNAYRQVWVGASPDEKGGVRIFLLSDVRHTTAVETSLSVVGFKDRERLAEYHRLGKFLVAVWEWRGTQVPAGAHVELHEATVIAGQLERLVTDPQAAVLEVLRGLRLRTRDLLADLGGLDAEAVASVDAWLARRGAPTLTELRGSFRSPE